MPERFRRVSLALAVLLTILVGGRAAAQEANRDRHGPPDVARYVAALENEARVRELDPEGVIRTLGIAEDAVVADLGVGPGVFALPLARHLKRGLLFAVDVEPRQLDALREKLIEQKIENVVPVLASHSDPHLPPRGVDWILVVDTYHHIDDRVAYLRRLRGDLRADGRLVILEYKPGELPVGPPAAHKLSREVRFRELEEAGFVRTASHATHVHHDFEVWRAAER